MHRDHYVIGWLETGLHRLYTLPVNGRRFANFLIDSHSLTWLVIPRVRCKKLERNWLLLHWTHVRVICDATSKDDDRAHRWVICGLFIANERITRHTFRPQANEINRQRDRRHQKHTRDLCSWRSFLLTHFFFYFILSFILLLSSAFVCASLLVVGVFPARAMEEEFVDNEDGCSFFPFPYTTLSQHDDELGYSWRIPNEIFKYFFCVYLLLWGTSYGMFRLANSLILDHRCRVLQKNRIRQFSNYYQLALRNVQESLFGTK